MVMGLIHQPAPTIPNDAQLYAPPVPSLYSLLKHITLENNENKPVTNSRDTPEVKLEPGLKLLKIFKEHSSKTCILDDFDFYESRQKTIQEKKAKQQQQFQKQVWEGKTLDEKNAVVANASEELKVVENGSIATGEAPKGAKPVVAEKKVVSISLA